MKPAILFALAFALALASAAAQVPKIGGVDVVRGGVVEFEVPLLPEAKADVAKVPDGSTVQKVKVAVLVPANFDPKQPWPVMVANVTTAAHWNNIGVLHLMKDQLVAKGWAGLAADGPFKPPPEANSNEWHWAMISSALAAMHAAWPESRQWPFAAGGFSGGARRAGFLAARMSKEKYNVIGIFMPGLNQDTASAGLELFKPAPEVFKKVPIFLSAGAQDNMAGPEQVAPVKGSMEKTGFSAVRLENHPGAHVMSAEHLGMALDWFKQSAATVKPAAAPAGVGPSSDGVPKKPATPLPAVANRTTPLPAVPMRATPLPATPKPAMPAPPTTPAPAMPSSATPQIGGVAVVPGGMVEFEVPLLPETKRDVAKVPNGSTVKTVKAALVVPADFDPKKPWPVMVAGVTVDAEYTNISVLRDMKVPLVAKGWVGIAADGPFKPEQKDNSHEWHCAMNSSALAAMHTAWPESRQWPFAAGGFSGGAKRSGWVAAQMVKDKYHLIGLFMGGCNQDTATEAFQWVRPGAAVFKKLPIFLSSGAQDHVATPEQVSGVKASMEATGFKDVRLESYPATHVMSQEHLAMALDWFKERAATEKPGAIPKGTGKTSSFNDLFKKTATPAPAMRVTPKP